MPDTTPRFALLPKTGSGIWSSLGIGVYLLSLYVAFSVVRPSPPAAAPETQAAPSAPVAPDGSVPVAGGGTTGTVVVASGQVPPARPALASTGASLSIPLPPPDDNRPAFFIAVGGFLVMLACLGMRSVGRFAGVLITERNVMSLSRFQTALWTGIILSGLVAITFAQIKGGAGIELSIPTELWALMGISTASLVGTPLILSNKKASAAKAGSGTDAVFRNESAREAAFGDLIEGDEHANASTVDLSKVQMFAFTIVSLAVYLAALIHVLKNFQPAARLPVPSDGLLALLGVSHAGYLTYKAVNHSDPSPGAPPASGGTGTPAETPGEPGAPGGTAT